MDESRSDATGGCPADALPDEAEPPLSDGCDVGRPSDGGTPPHPREVVPEEKRRRVEGTVSDLLDLLGKAHAMAVLREFTFADGPLRFSDLEDALGVSPNTLSARLKELVGAGLLVRESYDEIPPRVEYRPTEKAEALFPAFAHFHGWACEHDLEPVDASEIEATQ